MLQGSAEVIDISTAVVTAATQTYSGGAKTPAVTVTLNGDTIPSSGYDVMYSNNTNAGTANITVTGKGDYTGTATGTFTINKATGSVSFSTSSVSKYDVESTYTQTASKTGDGSLSYSSNNTSVATVNSSGKVTFKSAGTVRITATLSAGTNYTGASTYYTLTITALAAATTFDLALSQWELYNSDSTTRYYRSTNHDHSTTSTLTLTAIASGSITLNVRSNGESNYDYIIVKHNSTQIESTSEKPSTSTYTTVYRNVSAGDTITVSYKKDASVHSGDDTGYLKLALSYLAPPSYTAPSAKSLTYNGSSQALLNAGSVTRGTIYYSSDGTIWSTSIPTATTAGSYTSYWKIVAANDSSYDKASASISTTIAKASRSLSFPYLISVMVPGSSVANPAIPSAGNGEGTITYSSGTTSKATVNSSTGEVTGVASGTSVITASMSAGTNYAAASATYTMTVTTEINNFAYTGSVQSVSLPASIYQLQVWGAQGGGDGYGYTNGGKGGYSVGQLTISQATGVRVYVGGQGGSSSAGYNGGGSTTGYSSYNSGGTNGYSYMGGGGGASDIRLSDGALLSRMIVAGGGSGGAYTYRQWEETEYVTESESVSAENTFWVPRYDNVWVYFSSETHGWAILDVTNYRGWSYSLTLEEYNTSDIDGVKPYIGFYTTYPVESGVTTFQKISSQKFTQAGQTKTGTVPSNAVCVALMWRYLGTVGNVYSPITFSHQVPHTTTDSSYDYTSGYAGGGTNGAGYSSSYYGKQSSAGSNGSFGQGANQTISNYRHCSGAGGGGWYGGGGGSYSDSSMSYIYYMGGGSGWVNTSASSGNRPSGYTGLQLDSGTTYAGNTSFPSTGGGTETGHSGNGYARIKWLSPLDAISDIVYSKLDASNVEYSSCTNPEWKHVLVDSEDKILAGIKKDGTIYISEYIQNL